MAKVPYECTLAGEKVEVLAKRINFKDDNLGVNRYLPVLQFCSHVEKKNCPVKKTDNQNSDVEGYPYKGIAQCEYLISLGYHD
jgi:hypothetical protein